MNKDFSTTTTRIVYKKGFKKKTSAGSLQFPYHPKVKEIFRGI